MTTFALAFWKRNARAVVASGLLCAALTGTTAHASGQGTATAQPFAGPALFDDFDYTGYRDPLISRHGWTLKSGQGGPGVQGATWRPRNITFGTEAGNSVMTLRSGTDGTRAGTEQTEIYHQRKF
ncbi:hypothetical protein ACI2L1_08585 [Streptomyces sp. NPDC019531]|uniref:hypothetical protein n=1 Tax=Streptomyces sp. NPDC019531 TaxID=3365062 RepID=UPI00384B72D6